MSSTADLPPLSPQRRTRRWMLSGLLGVTAACTGLGGRTTGVPDKALEASHAGFGAVPTRPVRIGYLALSSPDYPGPPAVPWVDHFREGLRDLGYVEGRDIIVEYRFANNDPDRLLTLTEELVHLPVDVLVKADTRFLAELKEMNKTIPVVMTVVTDPIGSGVALSIREPGGKFTGIRLEEPAIHGKRLEFLKEVAPEIRMVGVLVIDGTFVADRVLREVHPLAEQLHISVHPMRVRSLDNLPSVFEAAMNAGVDALYRSPDPQTLFYIRPLAELATRYGLPSVGIYREDVDGGLLLAYGANRASMFVDSARLVDRILRGASPATTPIELASRFDLFVNRSTARQLGLTIPRVTLLDAAGVVD